MRIYCRQFDISPMPITAPASNTRPEPRGKLPDSWNYCVTTRRLNTSDGSCGGKALTSEKNIGSQNSKRPRQLEIWDLESSSPCLLYGGAAKGTRMKPYSTK